MITYNLRKLATCLPCDEKLGTCLPCDETMYLIGFLCVC